MIRLIFILLLSQSFLMLGQETSVINGQVLSGEEAIPFATVLARPSNIQTTTDLEGNFELQVSEGVYTLEVIAQGYRTISQEITISIRENRIVNFELIEDVLGLDEIVVSSTRNRVERKKTPVVVSTLKPKLLTATQSITVADGLNYAPGVRVETNCQNCGFTQVRLNGLDGSYTQVLLNSRAVFTSLIGVYGLEQIPTNTIERLEVVRSGGSALFGSNAIAGTVNIITKDPILNTWEVGSNLALIDGDALDRVVNFNTSQVSDDLNSGFTLFGVYRNRDSYDNNDDGFTEIVELRNTSIGGKAFYKPNDRSKVSLNLNAIREYRRGGDRLDLAPQFTDITEELDHDTFIGGVDYEISSKDYSQKLQLYTSASITERDSYYGGLGGGRTQADSLLANNAFGVTNDLALVNGVQYTKTLSNENVLTAGVELNINDTEDEIPGYNRSIDQRTRALGGYAQFEWKPTDRFVALLGARLDNVAVDGDFTVGGTSRNVDVNQTAFSPRITISYNLTDDLKFRGGYARGFRAPQAFNEDLHISSVGGEPQFVILSDNLKTEFSNAYTGSFNYSKNIDLLQLDFLAEGFYTTLQDPFTIVSTGATLENGSIIEEVRNGSGATVYGTNLEFGVSPNKQWQFQLGGTLQQTRYDEPQILFESDGAQGENNIEVSEFVRTPDVYGYFNTSYKPNKKWNFDLTGTFTGNMIVPRVISETGFLELNDSGNFFDLNLKAETHFDLTEDFMMTLSGGIKNIFNSYQDDFDVGPLRDSDYVYGPNAPRTIFIGIKFGKFH